jgi:CxxC-x17-CxxC domain-containing protein
VGQFISNPLIRNLIGQVKSTIDMRDIMDQQKIFIMDLSKGRIGEDNSRLLGALLITRLQLAAMSRVDIPEEDRKDFYLYVDEFQNFATESFTNILSEARKYRLNITLGHQYIGQLSVDNSTKMRDAVFGNVGTLAVFRVGAEDAEFLEREFTPEFTAEDLVNLPKYNVYLKLMIDGVSGHPFSAETLPPPTPLEDSNRDKIIRASRERYGVKKELVEEKITRWAGFMDNKGIAPADEKKAQGDANNNQTTLYDAVCSKCGKTTKVIFPPEKGRPVYCKLCLKKIKGEAAEFSKKEVPAPTFFGEEVKIENVSFNSHRPDKSPDGHFDRSKSKRKEINLSELRKALEESLENPKDAGDKKSLPDGRQGEIKPGQTIKL